VHNFHSESKPNIAYCLGIFFIGKLRKLLKLFLTFGGLLKLGMKGTENKETESRRLM